MKYVILPESALKDNSLKPITRLILAEIVSLTRQDGYCFATNPYFAKEYELNEKTVSRHLASLAKKKYIKIVVDKKRGNERKIFLVGDFKKQVDEIWTYNENKKIEEEQVKIIDNVIEDIVIEDITDDIISDDVKEDKPKKKKTKKESKPKKPKTPFIDADERFLEVIAHMNKISNRTGKRKFGVSKEVYPYGMAVIEAIPMEDILSCVEYVYYTYYWQGGPCKYGENNFKPLTFFKNYSNHWEKFKEKDFKYPKPNIITDEDGDVKFRFYYIEDGELKGTDVKKFDKDCYRTKEEALKHKSSL